MRNKLENKQKSRLRKPAIDTKTEKKEEFEEQKKTMNLNLWLINKLNSPTRINRFRPKRKRSWQDLKLKDNDHSRPNNKNKPGRRQTVSV